MFHINTTHIATRLWLLRQTYITSLTASKLRNSSRKYCYGRAGKEIGNVYNNNLFISLHLLRRKQFGWRDRKLSTSSCLYKKHGNKENDEKTDLDNTILEDFETEEYKGLVARMFRIQEMGHQVFIIQPYVKWGPSKKELTTPNYLLSESVALIESLKNWKVIDKQIVPLSSLKKQKLFGSGKLEELKKTVKQNKLITSIFVSINLLTKAQREFLEDEFEVPFFDRYSIVIQIFRERAVTKEAKLQVAMAEIPYLWQNIRSNDSSRSNSGITSIGGSGETWYEVRKMLLDEQEKKIKKSLSKLKEHRQLIRTKRKKHQFPVIAVVGYTNAGKTSLIKALTEEKEMQPKNELFATLDVTCHRGLLPSNMKVLYVDTIGFISDIPTTLIEPFVVTLEDALQADVIVHVIDISNPDSESQLKHVMKTLEELKLESHLLENIISVANKVDLLTQDKFDNIPDYMLPISSVKGTGLLRLQERIESSLLKNTDRIKIRIRVANGGQEFSWLHKESTVVKIISDEKDAQFILMDVIITKSNLEKFKYNFITLRKHDKHLQ